MRRTAVAATTLAALLAIGGTAAYSSDETTTSRPAALGASSPDLTNPLRGQYVWDPLTKWPNPSPKAFPQSSGNPSTRSRTPWPAVSTYYTRVAWSDLEAPDGSLAADSPLERRIAAAAARGQRTIFRVVMLDLGDYPTATGRLYPARLAGSVGEWTTIGSQGQPIRVPDWNSPAYVEAVEKLVADLGRRYDADPRVVGFEISGYGTWGEWNDVGWGDRLPPGRTRITPATTSRILRATVDAFPTTQLFALNDTELVRQALAASPWIGLRVDCLGQWSGGGAWERLLSVPGARDRWRTAPVATETCSSNYDAASAPVVLARNPSLRPYAGSVAEDDLYANARRQVAQWHVSLVSSGNFPGAGAGRPMSDTQIEAYRQAAAWSGYRYRTSSVETAPTAGAGSTTQVAVTWVNEGVAPLYGKPRVLLQLRERGAGAAVAEVRSAVDLPALVGDGGPDSTAPVAVDTRVEDSLDIPAGTRPGRYDLVAVVDADISGVREPIQLAQEGRQPDGSYRLATIDIG